MKCPLDKIYFEAKMNLGIPSDQIEKIKKAR